MWKKSNTHREMHGWCDCDMRCQWTTWECGYVLYVNVNVWQQMRDFVWYFPTDGYIEVNVFYSQFYLGQFFIRMQRLQTMKMNTGVAHASST